MDEDNYRDNGEAGDDPQAAFEQLRGEVALERLAVEGLARAREAIEIPDRHNGWHQLFEPLVGKMDRRQYGIASAPAQFRCDELRRAYLFDGMPDDTEQTGASRHIGNACGNKVFGFHRELVT